MWRTAPPPTPCSSRDRDNCRLYELFALYPTRGGWRAGERVDRSEPAADGSAPAAERSYPIGAFPRQARIVLQALKEYGMILADNGSDWYVSGAPHPKWSNDELRTLRRGPAPPSRSSTERR